MEETKKTSYNLIAAILFALAALIGLVNFISALSHLRPSFAAVINIITSVIAIGGYVVLTISLIQRRGDKLTLLGFALVVLTSLISFFAGFRYGMNGFLTNLLRIAGSAGALAVAAVYFTEYLPQYRDKAKKLWFVPAVCIAAQIILRFFSWIIRLIIGGGYYHISFWQTLFVAAAILFACMWIVYPEGMPKKQYTYNADNSYAPVSDEDGYFDLAAHVLLLIFTCGIWYYVWIYRMTKYLNCVQDEEPRNPVTKLLLCMFIPFYSLYWVYKSAQRIDKLAASRGVQSDFATLCLILAIFVSIVPPILMQEKINSMIKRGQTVNTTAETTAQTPSVGMGVPEELTKYKELLDNGVITQEEFDEKKKQLLNL